MSLISNLNNKNEDLIELNKDTFKNSFNFNIPNKNTFIDDNLFNKKKISDDVISMSSRSSRSSKISSNSNSKYEKAKYMNNIKNIYKNKFNRDKDIDGSTSGSDTGYNNVKNKKKFINDDVSDTRSVSSDASNSSNGSDGSSGSGGSDGSDESGGSGESGESGGSGGSYQSQDSRIIKKKYMSPKDIIKQELNEKREIIYQLDRLESKGYKIPFKFNMNSDLEEMKSEYSRIIKEKELDGSIRFQQKMLMAFVSGSEYMNNRYDPFSIKLDGWSEQVNENINDYDDIFEELHYKYKSTGKKMAPELRLFISLSGSAFMFHLTSRMFKDQPLPDIENVLKSDPELMKQFQNAAAKQYMMGNTIPQNVNNINQRENLSQKNSGMSDSMGIFGMVNNLFGSLTSDMSSTIQSQSYQKPTISNERASYNNTTEDIDNIIKNVHSKISIDDDFDNRIETLSVSDEEITSIIEDTADIHILKKTNAKRNKVNNDKRTLNI
jgi:hypothetical protein